VRVASGDRLRQLGYDSYADYLRSAHWRRVRLCYWASGREIECAVCGDDERIELHHYHYRSLGHERPSDLLALCHRHHRDVHRLRREEPWRAWTQCVRELRRRVARQGGHHEG
jgi:hypothetical protein